MRERDPQRLSQVARRCNLVGTEDLLAAIGFGGVTLHQVLNRLREELRLATEAEAPVISDEELARNLTQQGEQTSGPSTPLTGHGDASPILGLEGLEYRLGGCCSAHTLGGRASRS